MAADEPELLEVGRIIKPHGLDGSVVVRLTTDRDERVEPGSVLQTDRGPLTVARSRPHQDRWIVTFDGVANRDGAEALRQVVLLAEPIDDPDTTFVHELIGSDVVLADGTSVGLCVAVVDNPAHDLLELEDGRLVPMVFVAAVSPGRIEIEPPEGLLDL